MGPSIDEKKKEGEDAAPEDAAADDAPKDADADEAADDTVKKEETSVKDDIVKVSAALANIPALPGQSSKEPEQTEDDKVNEALAEAEESPQTAADDMVIDEKTTDEKKDSPLSPGSPEEKAEKKETEKEDLGSTEDVPEPTKEGQKDEDEVGE